MPNEGPMSLSRSNSSGSAAGANSPQSKAFQHPLKDQFGAATELGGPSSQPTIYGRAKNDDDVQKGQKRLTYETEDWDTSLCCRGGGAPPSSAGGRSLRPDAAPSLINHRSVRRTSSGRVRAVGRTACCYMAREGAHKLRITIEARLRADAEDPNPNESNFVIASQGASALQLSSASLTGSTNFIPTLSLEDQAKEVKDAITTMVKGMPPLIPGTPIIVIFNAILEHEPENEGRCTEGVFLENAGCNAGWKGEAGGEASGTRGCLQSSRSQSCNHTTKTCERKRRIFFIFGKEKAKSTTSLGPPEGIL
ncbi:hypothetical protein BC829DRAFT_418882 [Chytridium lagenaria]|nr:hypothetical protein BC829DRAFT_418882 [Chytridium lagenaria]